MSHADYRYVKVMPDMVWIEDVGHDVRPSVTNDAEAVVREVHERYPGRRIIYRDSDGRWDELCHHNGTFLQFRNGGAYGLPY